MKRISILGLGYIGLPTAILAAESGYNVFGFDINEEKVKSINEGDPTIIEPEIQMRLINALQNKNLQISDTLYYADCFVITVPTPIKSNKSADLSYVFSAVDLIAKRIMPGNLVILESTVPVGTTDSIARRIEEISGLRHEIDFFTVHSPERVLPGKIFKELIENDRVIGGSCQKACDLARQFYGRFVKGFIHITDDKTAEMVKLIENSSRDVQLAFANQVAAMCAQAGMDPYTVIELANRHPRVHILSPSCGVGGHCIAVDPWFLVESFPEDTLLLRTAREINDKKPYQVLEKVLQKVEEFTVTLNRKPTVLALGLTFKPDVDDLRESPALKIACQLATHNEVLSLITHDPNLSPEKLESLGLVYEHDFYKAVKNADIILVLVKHKQFIVLGDDLFCDKILLDTCGLLYEIMKSSGKDMLKGAIRIPCTYENVTV